MTTAGACGACRRGGASCSHRACRGHGGRRSGQRATCRRGAGELAQQGTPFLLPFGDYGMVAHPNRWRAQAGELVLAENLVVENDLLQKDPSSTYYFRDASGTNSIWPSEWFSLAATF